jgi:hypothetical protein
MSQIKENKMKYQAEVRVFDSEDGMDYINDSCEANDWKEALRQARWVGKQLGGKVKINILKNLEDEGGNPEDWWCFFSKIYYFGPERVGR